MKKLFMVLAFAGVAVSGMAQDEVPVEKYSVSTNSFWSNWFIQANLVGTAFYSNQEKKLDLDKSPFKGFRNNLGVSLAIGKWFTPGIGLRTKATGIWGRTVSSDDKQENANKYWIASEQVLFNLSNMLCGYSDTRVWNFIPYFGGNISRNMSYDTYSMGLGVGVLNTWRLGKKLNLNLDLAFNAFEPDFDGDTRPGGNNRFSLTAKDRTFTAEIGLTYKLGKATWNKTPDVEALKALSQSEIDALNALLADKQAENDQLRNMINSHKCPEAKAVTVKEITVAPISVFFNINKTKIASKKDLQDVKELAEIAKKQNSKLIVTGYADSRTGNPTINQRLSEKRAQTLADELVKMGVNRDNIELVAKGGVNDLAPFSFNRRATVAIK